LKTLGSLAEELGYDPENILRTHQLLLLPSLQESSQEHSHLAELPHLQHSREVDSLEAYLALLEEGIQDALLVEVGNLEMLLVVVDSLEVLLVDILEAFLVVEDNLQLVPLVKSMQEALLVEGDSQEEEQVEQLDMRKQDCHTHLHFEECWMGKKGSVVVDIQYLMCGSLELLQSYQEVVHWRFHWVP